MHENISFQIPMIDLSESIKNFVMKHFETIIQIEVLCFLYKNRGIHFTPQSISRMIFINNSLTFQLLEKFNTIGFVTERGGYYQFNDSVPEDQERCIDAIASNFEEQRKIYVSLLYDSFMKGK